MLTHRQGDLLFVATKAAKAKPAPDGTILARGEATGHTHRIETADLANADVFLDESGRLVVKVKRGKVTRVIHEEHGTITLPEGTWEVRRQREYQPKSWHQVAD